MRIARHGGTNGEPNVLVVTGERFDTIRLRATDRHRLILDMEHSYRSHHGDVWCCALPELGIPVPHPHTHLTNLPDGTVLLDARTSYHAALAAGSHHDQPTQRSIFAQASEWGLITSSSGGLPEHNRTKRIFVGSIGYVRERGPYHADRVLSQSTFFVMDPLEQVAPFSAVGDVYGLLAAQGSVDQPALLPRNALLMMKDSSTQICRLGIEDMDIAFSSGTLRSCDRLDYRFFIRAGTYPRSHTTECAGAVDVAITGSHVVAFKRGGGMPIPMTGCVLRLLPQTSPVIESYFIEMLETRRVSWRLTAWPDVQSAFQSGPRILHDGVFGIAEEEALHYSTELQAASVPFSSREAWDDCSTPKAGLGFSSDGKVVHVTADRIGVRSLAECLTANGAVSAVLLDGGGSTCAFLGSGVLFSNRESRKDPLANWDRPLPLALGIR